MSTCRLAQVLLPVSAYGPAILICSRLCAPAMHLCAQVKATHLLGMSSRTIHTCTIFSGNGFESYLLCRIPAQCLRNDYKKLPCQSS